MSDGQESQVDCELNIYFVVTKNQKNENDCSDDMWHAFNSCNDHELAPKWIGENQCDELTPGKKDVFVLEEFEGPTFDKLETFKCSRIVGPRCLLSCFMTGESIPEGTSPVFTTAMRGLVVSVSGLSVEAKEKVGRMIERMGGVYSRQLRSSATHLIANFVMSAKYERAVELKIPIMTEQWVTAVWEVSLRENVLATSSRFDEHKCPVFMNLVVTTTNLSKRKKIEMKESITDNGGIFMGALDGTKVKIVIAPENSSLSDKLKYALQNNIACVNPNWVNRSIEKGYALPFERFLIHSTKACSTPEKSHADVTLNFSTLSTIPGDPQPNHCIEESVMSTTMSTTIDQRSSSLTKVAYVEVLARLDIRRAKMAGPFLDGCNIYLTGFPADHRDKINRVLNAGSATRLDDISDALTHVIVGDPSKAITEIKQMKSLGLSPYFLTINWLEESMKLKCPAAEEGFWFKINEVSSDERIVEPPSPLSKKNLQLLQKPRRPPVPSFDIDKKINYVNNIEEPDLFQEYLRPDASIADTTEKTLRELSGARNDVSTPKINDENDPEGVSSRRKFNDGESVRGTVKKPSIREPELDVTAVTATQPSEITERIFEGLTFILTGFDDEQKSEIVDNVAQLGGKIIPKSFKGIPDFGVVPFFGAPLKHTVNEIVTDIYIEDCIDHETLVEVNYYHKPISLNEDAAPLSGCVIAMSSYTGKERTFLSNIAEALGARYQDTFARKTYLNKNTYGCTHLVCPSPEGSKYNAAVKWQLPAVTAEWLLTCLARETRVDETPYLVGETILVDGGNGADEQPETTTTATATVTTTTVIPITTKTTTTTTTTTTTATPPPPPPLNPEKSLNFEMRPTLNTSGRQILTPKRNLTVLQNTGSTPTVTPVNKRLSIGDWKTPPSPFHIDTPETPYGQFLKPNPGPSTRKRWLKWVEDMPDLMVEEPPLRRRQLSTPLSELKRQFWSAVKKPLRNEKAGGEDGCVDEVFALDGDSKHRPAVEETVEYADASANVETPIRKALSFRDDGETPTKSDQINLQIAQLDQVLQASIPDARHSSSSESSKQPIYDSELPDDHIEKGAPKDSQLETVGWEAPVQRTTLRRKSTIPDEVREQARPSLETLENRERPSEDVDSKIPMENKRKFMLSGINERRDCAQAITNLGGEVSTESSYDSSATHLLCIKLARNEKLLASIAAGKWVLHYSFLKDSQQQGKFLDEENYEWGNPKSEDIVPKPRTETERQIAAAVYRWRLKLLKNPGGAFVDVVALLMGPEEKCQQFRRLICAGGGSVVEARPPYDASPKSKKITHCFIQLKQLDQPVDWAMMASKGILCFLPQYLSDHLTAETPLNPRECVLPEFKKYLSLLPK